MMRPFTLFRIVMSLSLLALTVLPHSDLTAQYVVKQSDVYGGTSEDFGFDLDINEDGMTILGGKSFSNDIWVPENKGGNDFWLMQTDASGDTMWSRTYGGQNNDDLFAVEYAEDGLITAFGTTRSTGGDVGDNPGFLGAWLLRLDADGEVLTTRVYGGQLGEQGIDFETLNDGYALLVQSTSPELEGAINNGNFDYWVSEVSVSGAVRWANFYGGSDADVPMRIRRVPGGYMVAGRSNSTDGQVIGNQGGFDYWVLRLDSEGNIIWARTYGGSGDDMANEILPLTDGTFLLVGQSDSEDGDKTEAKGGDDLWMLRIDGEGEIIWERTYGGSNEDIGLRAEQLAGGQIAILGSTRSDDGDVTGNKGNLDAWVLVIDALGNLVQQMNYGGLENDVLNALIVDEDDAIRMIGTTHSRSANLPGPTNGLGDMWLFGLATDTMPCLENTECFVEDIDVGIFEIPTGGGQFCINGCNVGAPEGPSGISCQDFSGKPSAWFKVRTDSDAEELTISVRSDEFNSPQIAILQSTDCQTFLRLDCAFGANGRAEIINVDVEPDTAYYIVVADEATLAGEFIICAQVTDKQFCNNAPLLYANNTSLGSPLEGPYLPGETVQFCYEIPEWEKLSCNGLQGIVPSFGPGWDSTYFEINGRPTDVDSMLIPIANGTWKWEALGTARYNFTNPSQGYVAGQGLPPGWYFTNLDDPEPNDNPNQSIGDLIDCDEDTSAWKVCWSLRTYDECTEDLDCSVTVKSFADGEIGRNISQTCQFDEPLTHEAILKCCINPFISPIPNSTICSGDTITRLFESNLEPPVLYRWTVETFGNIVGAEPGSGPLLSQQLFNFGTDMAQVTYTVEAISPGCEAAPISFTVVVRTIPSGRMSLVDEFVCSGRETQLRFTFQGTPPFRGQFSIDGELQPEFVSEEATAFLPVTLEETSLVTFANMRDASCFGSTTGSFVVDVTPTAEFDTIATICNGDTFNIGEEKFFVTGVYSSTIENGSSTGCDSIVNLQLFVRQPSGEDLNLIICEGDSVVIGDNVYTETGVYNDVLINRFGCDSIIDLTLFVTTEILTEENVLLCGGETLQWRGRELTESGIYRDTVSANDQCDSVFVLQLTAFDVMTLSETIIVPDTGDAMGSIEISISGGLAPYSYLWSTGDTTDMISELEAGEYSVTITDFADCEAEFNFALTTSTVDPIRGLSDLNVYPNPVQKGSDIWLEFTLDRADIDDLLVELRDINGRQLSSRIEMVQPGSNRIRVTLSDVASQILLVSMTDRKTGRAVIRPIVVE